MLNGLPTSKYGTVLNKRCEWCYSVMVPTERMASKELDKSKKKDIKDKMETKQYDIMTKKFCSKDCKEEYTDWRYFVDLRLQRERMAKKYKKIHPDKQKEKGKIKDRTEYFQKYLEKNRDKKREQAKQAMRKKRLLDKIK